jgi:adenine-specific DNA-methyltransferase
MKIKVFVGGSRAIRRLDSDVSDLLDDLMAKGEEVLVGDANGVDKSVQQYLCDHGYAYVQVYCSGSVCRNNVGNWETRSVASESNRKDLRFYMAKDRSMAELADMGLMIWDEESAGTLLNAYRLVRRRKHCLLYSAKRHHFNELNAIADWNAILAIVGEPLRSKVETEIEEENQDRQEVSSRQMTFLEEGREGTK